MFHLCVIVGTRPEAIKMAPIIIEARTRKEISKVTVIATGQHDTMLKDALAAFDLTADVNLENNLERGTLGQLNASLLKNLEEQFHTLKPNLVLVHGDTTSAQAAAMAAFYAKIQVGHVEAGLRTGDLFSPFPEECNRKIISVVANYHFSPTQQSVKNLLHEGVSAHQISETGNTVIDALLTILRRIEADIDTRSKLNEALIEKLGCDVSDETFVLITAHRRENWGKGIDNICIAIKKLAAANPHYKFIFPVHLNPLVKEPVSKHLAEISNICLVAPLNYVEFCWLMHKCRFIISDSGGIQEEAPAIHKPVLVTRDTSERPEAIEAGTAKLVATDPAVIEREAQRLIDDTDAYNKMSQSLNPFGDGSAAKQIINNIIEQV